MTTGSWDLDGRDRATMSAKAINLGGSTVEGALGSLSLLTTGPSVVILNNMKAVELLRRRIPCSEVSCAELVLGRLPTALAGSCLLYTSPSPRD